MMARPLRIAMVAGEHSGDLLGAGLLRALRAREPNLVCEGIGGTQMIAAGCTSLYPLERLAVMGITEILGRYREISGMRAALRTRWLRDPPDVFIGVDAPEFNLGLEEPLRAAGIPTVHYVSPTVWAWRGYRIKRIRRAVSHMLTLFPFEADYYAAQNIPVTCVGHPMAAEIPDVVDRASARRALGLPPAGTVIALLPGSRARDLRAHAPLFVATAQWLHVRHPHWRFVVPLIDAAQRDMFTAAIARAGAAGLPWSLLAGRGREAMAAADGVLLKSGTAALEAMLLKRPMVVTYKTSALSYFLIRRFSHVRLYSMPNHLARRELAPELMQDAAVPERLGPAIEAALEPSERNREALAVYAQLHATLKRDTNNLGAAAVLALACGAHTGVEKK